MFNVNLSFIGLLPFFYNISFTKHTFKYAFILKQLLIMTSKSQMYLPDKCLQPNLLDDEMILNEIKSLICLLVLVWISFKQITDKKTKSNLRLSVVLFLRLRGSLLLSPVKSLGTSCNKNSIIGHISPCVAKQSAVIIQSHWLVIVYRPLQSWQGRGLSFLLARPPAIPPRWPWRRFSLYPPPSLWAHLPWCPQSPSAPAPLQWDRKWGRKLDSLHKC